MMLAQMNFNGLLILVNKKVLLVNCDIHDLQVLKCHYIQGQQGWVYLQVEDTQEVSCWVIIKLSLNYLKHLLIKVSCYPFLFNFKVKINRFLLTFFKVSLLDLQRSHQFHCIINQAYQVQMKIINCHQLCVKVNLQVIWVFIIILLVLSISIECHLEMGV